MNTISFQARVEDGAIRLHDIYRKTFTKPVHVILRESGPSEAALSGKAITERLNEVYGGHPAVLDEDIQAAQYHLLGEEDW